MWLQRVRNRVAIVAPLWISLSNVLGNADSQITDRNGYLPARLGNTTHRNISTQSIPAVIKRVIAELSNRSERSLAQTGDIGELILESLFRTSGCFLRHRVVVQAGNRENRVLFAVGIHRGRVDVHRLNRAAGRRIRRGYDLNYAPFVPVPLNEHPEPHCKHGMNRKDKLLTVDDELVRKVMTKGKIVAPSTVGTARSSYFLDPVQGARLSCDPAV